MDKSINKNFDRIKLLLKTIPETPGVYRYYDDSGKVLYVGKARNLKRRVSSYFSHFNDLSPKIRILVRKIYDIFIADVNGQIEAIEKVQEGGDVAALKSEAEMMLATTQSQLTTGVDENGEQLSEADKVNLLREEAQLLAEIAAYEEMIKKSAFLNWNNK